MRLKGKHRRINLSFRAISINKQIALSMSILSIVTIIILGVVIFSISKITIENNYQSAHRYNLQVSSNIIELQLKTIVERARSLLNNQKLKEIVETDQSNAPYFSSKNRLVLDRILTEQASYESSVQSMLLIGLHGNWVYQSKKSTESGFLDHYYQNENILDQDWISVATKLKGKEVFYGYNVLFSDGKDDVFSMVKLLVNPKDQSNMGYLVINIKKSLLSKVFGKEDGGYRTNKYMILDRGDITGHKDELKSLVYYDNMNESKEFILDEYTTGISSGKYLYSTYHNDISGWDIVNVIEKRELSNDSAYIGGVILIAGLLLIIFSLLVSKMISEQISRPLHGLETMIQEVGQGNYQIEIDFDESEVGKIGTQFKHMVTNNLELRDRLLKSELHEREAELLLLQSQINPHFLYNTLDALYFMAVINHSDDIAEIVLALSDTFKLSLNQGKKLIQIKDELKKVEAYMKVQNLRYHNRFDFLLEIDPTILQYQILSFIIQPIVENAVYHGLEAKIGRGCVSIQGNINENIIRFDISDNGVGISDFNKLEQGYAIKNIRERMHLYYGEGCDLKYYSKVGEGTTVTLQVPVIKEEDNYV